MDLIDTMARRSDEPLAWRIGVPLAGVVKNVRSSDGWVKARFGAQGDQDESGWLRPLWPGGIESLPNVGDACTIVFIDGDPSQGAYACYPSSKTRDRPTEAMLLATTFAGLYNDLATKFNTLKARHNTLVTAYDAHTHNVVNVQAGAATIASATPTASGATDADANAAKCLAADGSEVSAIASNKIVLSSKAKVRG